MCFLSSCISLLVAAPPDDLYRRFLDPPREHTIQPYWSWVEDIDPNEVRRQIREMVSQHVYGALVFAFDGLRTPYLSGQWMQGMEAALDEARKQRFTLGFITDYSFPQGDFRDIWNLDPPQSHVVRANPAFRRKRLAYVESLVDGPFPVSLRGLKNPAVAVAGKLDANGAYLEETLSELTPRIRGGRLDWQAPEGRWRVLVFCLEERPMRNAWIDMMNRDAVGEYIRRVLEPQYLRFKQHFGSTIRLAVSDHEGSYGHRVAWTPALFQTFAARKGYRLEKYLPLLAFEGGKLTEKVRCDYLDVVSELYSENYWGQITDWFEARGVKLTGHEWEESTLATAAFQGDLFRIFRRMSIPGIDSLYNWAESPRHFKEAASVAHFLERPFWCENQILQGSHSFISPEKMKYGTNMAAVWGSTILTPWFNYGKEITAYPPVWDWRQPFWKQFHYYADYARRLSFMNSNSRHVAQILLFNPLTTAWAHSSPVFNETAWDFGRTGPRRDPRDPDSSPVYDFYWRNPADYAEQKYSELMEALPRTHRDFDVTDDHFLERARIEGRELVIGPERFSALILPPLTTIRRGAMEKINAFHAAGGIVLALNRLPSISMESGRDDPRLKSTVPVVNDVEAILRALDEKLPKDFQASVPDVYYHHRVKDGVHSYWVVNNSPQAREAVLRFAAPGKPERWHPHTGERSALPDRVSLAPWDAFYAVMTPEPVLSAHSPRLLASIGLGSGGWRFRPLADSVPVPYRNGRWLSPERLTITDWLCLGPFPAKDHEGYNREFSEDPSHWWREYRPYTAGDEDFVTDLNNLFVGGAVGSVGYAKTWVYAPQAGEYELQIAADNARVRLNGAEVLAFHHMNWYRENRAAWAQKKKVRMQQGWNELVVKLERDSHFRFYCRFVPYLQASTRRQISTPPKIAGIPRVAPKEETVSLGSLSKTWLENYSGSFSYEKEFTLPAEHSGKRTFLDCGEVGVVMEAFVNGRNAGERPWKPFRLEITSLVKPGINTLRIVVSNSDANARAVAGRRSLLQAIDLNGLLGPVRLEVLD